MTPLRLVAVTVAAAAMGCGGTSSDSVLVMRVTLAPTVPVITASKLSVALTTGAAGTAVQEFSNPRGGGITFPTSLSALLPRSVAGPLEIEVKALDDVGVLALGRVERVPLAIGGTKTIDVVLECGGATCRTDGGADAATDAAGDGGGGDALEGPTTCGNGKLDPGESCDTAIAAQRPGACPPSDCDDDLACTRDVQSGEGCLLECAHFEIKTTIPGDGCCPAGGTHATDNDCSATCGNGTIEAGETCDTGIPSGTVGACRVASECSDGEDCTTDSLLSAGTCSARCLNTPITKLAEADRCCPPGGSHNTDSDCPIVCGNGWKEMGETCDTAILAGMPGACPTGCDDAVACTSDTLVGSGCTTACMFTGITAFVSGDGCCPTGGNSNVDGDCLAVCGNGVVEMGEACDKAIAGSGPGACPAACPADANSCTRESLTGTASACSARCTSDPVTVCASPADGCCPSGCSFATDPDCSATCGNSVVDTGETCDTGIAGGTTGACPTTCSDGKACTRDVLQSAATCNATCTFPAITEFVSGDGCCPSGGDHNLDGDCQPVCGNRVVEAPVETCDKAIAAGTPGACPAACPPAVGCNGFMLTGASASCTARCAPTSITACLAGDGCCPAGCTRSTDNDCPAICGNGVHEPGEECDKEITAGNPGACPVTCDDQNPCTADTTAGNVEDCTRSCSRTNVTACDGGDMCCPIGCNTTNDPDCSATCGNGVEEAGETCDPPASCPTTCPDDGDLCTAERLSGDPLLCTAFCSSTAITTCSGTTRDSCCPTGCNANTDADCGATCPNGVTEPGEECDDGNTNDGDDCVEGCRRFSCGDGFKHTTGSGTMEECDDGNTNDGDDCVQGCRLPTCGDGFKHATGMAPFEECDDGNGSNADDCVQGCRLFTCGDGFRHTTGKSPFEECDDGNSSAGDACSPVCQNVEFSVAISPSGQMTPVAVVAKDGTFVVAWAEKNKFSSVIRARAFAANGVARTGEILLGGSPMSSTVDPDASVSDKGDKFLIAYASTNGGVIGGSSIRARVLAPDGQPVDGGEIFVHGVPDGITLARPRTTRAAGGVFFVAWQTEDPGRGDTFDGTELGGGVTGSPFTLIPAAARLMDADLGSYISTFVSTAWTDGRNADIHGAIHELPMGPSSAPQPVSVSNGGAQTQTAIATDDAGNRFILWSDGSSSSDPDCGSLSCGIEARYLKECIVSPCLPVVGSQFPVNAQERGEQKAGDVAFGRSHFVTVFETAAALGSGSDCSPTTRCDVAMRLFSGESPAVNPWTGASTEMLVNQDMSVPKQRPRVAVGLDGTVVVVWETHTGGETTIHARLFGKLLP